eukprot:Em0005g280a
MKKVNSITKKDAYLLPRVDDTLDTLGGSKIFSTLDLASGYWQVKVAEEDRPKTAFTTPEWLYEFKGNGLVETFNRTLLNMLSTTAGSQYDARSTLRQRQRQRNVNVYYIEGEDEDEDKEDAVKFFSGGGNKESFTTCWKSCVERFDFLLSKVGPLLRRRYNSNMRAEISPAEMLAVTLRFIIVDVGDAGRQSDAGVLSNSGFGQALENDLVSIPNPAPLTGTSAPDYPYVLVGDEGFHLKKYLLRPYAGKYLPESSLYFPPRFVDGEDGAGNIIEVTG